MNNLMLLGMMFCGGMAIALQPSINARLAQKVGVIESACISFAVGTLVLLLLLVVSGKANIKGIGDIAWWEWTGGALGAFFVSMTIFVVPRIGTAAAMSSIIAAQLITGMVLDHFGAFGLRQIPFEWKRGLGCVLLLAGVTLFGKR